MRKGQGVAVNSPSGTSDERPLPSGTDVSLPWNLRLPDRLEREFQDYFISMTQRIILRSMVVVVTLMLCGSVVEYLVEHSNLALTWRPRLLCFFALAALWWAVTQSTHKRLTQPAVLLFCFTLASTNNYLGSAIDHPLSYSYYLVSLFAVMLMGTLFRVVLYWALAGSALVIASLAVSLLSFSEMAATETLVVFFVVICGSLLSLIGQYFFERLQRQHFLAERVLALHRSELHSANRVLENQVTEDPLTGTVNRRGLESRLNELLNQYRGKRRDGELFLLLFDIDFFKYYNDTYGHLAGDDCLKRVAGVPRSMVNEQADFVARYGGEEFVIVLSGIRHSDAMVFAERMRSRIEQMGIEHRSSRASNVVTISVGVSGVTDDTLRSDQLIARADEALYEAKRTGRNRVVALSGSGDFISL